MIRLRLPEPQRPDPHTGLFSLGCPCCGSDNVTAGPRYQCTDCRFAWSTVSVVELINLVHQHRNPTRLRRAA